MLLKKMAKRLYYNVSVSERKKKGILKKKMLCFFDNCNKNIEKIDLGKMADEINDWKAIFLGILDSSWGSSLDMTNKLFIGFAEEKLLLEKKAKSFNDFSAPIAILTQKNNLIYLQKFIPYYRNLGVKHFVIIDNNSTDNSIEYLKEQTDVTLFYAPYKFIGAKKAGWKLQALAYVGLDHWYIWLDSDEFLAYPQMENVKLPEYTRILESKNIKNVGGFMLDMYPAYCLMDELHISENFLEDYCYFDGAEEYIFIGDYLYGGMRGRILGIYDLRMDKTPLMFCTANNVPRGNHETYPNRKHLKNNYGCVLKHYKFLSSDVKRYKEIATDQNSGYWSASIQQDYLKLIGNEVKTENSLKYIDSKSLFEFPYIKDFITMEN